LRRVTEPFFTTKEQGKGTGLGLSTVYGFAKQSGGALRIYSEVGCGTTVRLFFPSIVQAAVSEVASKKDNGLSEVPSGETVLIVEDQDDVGALVESILRKTGYQTLRVANAMEAIELLGKGVHVDLLFTDLIMPGGINGIALARQAIQLLPKLKVLLTTGYAEVDFDRHGANRAEFELISKPFRRAELVSKVRKVLDGQH
jgi:CheY-like chemotaxis protein